MKRFHLILALGMAVALVLTTPALAARRDIQGPELTKGEILSRLVNDFYGISSSHTEPLFVGSEVCMACHSGPNAVHGYDTSRWRNTLHSRPFKETANDRYTMVVGLGVIADSDGNGVDDFKDGLDFNDDGQTTFETYKPNAPVLGYSDATGYTMTIGDVVFRIFFAWGGNGMPAKQRYVVKIPVTDRPSGVSAGAYVSPLQFNEATDEWVPYHPENWWESDGTPIFSPSSDSAHAAQRGRSFDRRCSGCHFTGTTILQDSFGEWVSQAAPAIIVGADDPTYIDFNGDGLKEMTHIGCESCHGAGSTHIINRGDPTKIVRPHEDFTPQQANEACGACHVRGSSSDGTFGFPWDETSDHRFRNGDSLDNYLTSKPGLWPDGKTSKQHHQQFHDLYESSKPTFEFHMVYCAECHDPHADTKHQIVESIEEDEDGNVFEIATENDNNSLCLACHATHGPFEEISKAMVADLENNLDVIGEVVSAHSNHPYAPTRRMGLSRCSKCHMPKTAKTAIDYDIHSHTFEAIPPGKTLQYQAEGGMPSSCSVSCHRNIADIFPNSTDGSISDWTEASDVALAEWLMEYYGPDGKWWHTHDEGEEH